MGDAMSGAIADECFDSRPGIAFENSLADAL